MDSRKTRYLKEKARKISIKEGSFTSVQSSFGEYFISPFAVAINSSNSQIAMLSSFPGLLGPLSQLFSSRLIEKMSRKKIILFSVLIQALMWIPIITLAFLFYKEILTGFLPLFLIIFFSLFTIFGNLAGPAWFSWMGDVVEESHRGRYFSRRNKIIGLIAIITTIIAAFLLDFFRKNKLLMLGFGIFFFIAMTGRLISRNLLKTQYEPKIKLEKNYYFSFFQFIKKAPTNNFGKFAIYRALMATAVTIASPFFAVYMLKNLNFSYIIFILITLSETTFSLLVMPLWGKFADKYGNYGVLKITGVLVSIIPILWLISSSPLYLMFVPMLLSGIGWAGFNLATSNFIYDSVTPQRRGIGVSYFNILVGIGIFIGANIGALLVKYLTINFMNVILFIFLISSVLRLAVNLIMIPMVKEVKERDKFDSSRSFKNLIFKITKLPSYLGAHELIARKNKEK